MKRPLSIDPRKVAALFVDLQEEHRRDERYIVADFGTILARVRRLQDAARAAGVPVVHAAYLVDAAARALRPFHPVMPDGRSAFSNAADPLSAICPEVSPRGDEIVIAKSDASVFSCPDAIALLDDGGIEWLLVAGVWTEACVAATVRDAIDRGLHVVLVKDACGSGTAAMHQTAILNLANRLYGGAVADTDSACRLIGGDSVEAWQIEGSVPLRFTFESAEALYDQL